jgi:hypothetical protein
LNDGSQTHISDATGSKAALEVTFVETRSALFNRSSPPYPFTLYLPSQDLVRGGAAPVVGSVAGSQAPQDGVGAPKHSRSTIDKHQMSKTITVFNRHSTHQRKLIKKKIQQITIIKAPRCFQTKNYMLWLTA